MNNDDISVQIPIDEQNSNVHNLRVENSTPRTSIDEQNENVHNKEMDTSRNRKSLYILFHSQS
jgi:hypothetical protein